MTGNVTVVYDQTDPYSAEKVIETLNDFEDDIAVRMPQLITLKLKLIVLMQGRPH